MACWAKISG